MKVIWTHPPPSVPSFLVLAGYVCFSGKLIMRDLFRVYYANG